MKKTQLKNLRKCARKKLQFATLFILMMFLSFEAISSTTIAQQAKKQIVGTVVDERGTPVIGANVVEQGTSNGSITDIDGNFSLIVGENSTLQISYIGFVTQEIPVNNQRIFNITLLEDSEQLEEIVIVGYGTQKKANVTGAVSMISADDLGSQPITSAAGAMHGRVTGLQMIQGSGQPGNNAPVFQIRGVGTVRSTVDDQNKDSAPLILIDGVESTMNDLHPNDIESFSVLKDAASAAIYGARAANGVVLITTKRGKNRAPKVSLNSYYGFQNATAIPDMMNPYQFVLMMNEAYTNTGEAQLYSDDIVNLVKSGTDPRLYNGKFFDEGYRSNAPLMNHYLSVNGGTDHARYMVSLGYQDHEGIVIETSSKRYNFRSNIDINISEKIRIGLNISGSLTDSESPNYMGYGVTQFVRDMIRKYPLTPTFSEDGNVAQGSPLLTNTQDGDGANPIAYAKYGGQDQTKILRATPNMYLEYEPIKNFVLKANGSVFVENERSTERKNRMTVNNGTTLTTINGLGSLEEKTYNLYRSMFELTGRYFKNFGKSNVAALAGYSFQKYGKDYSSGQNEGYNYNFLSELDVGSSNPSVSGYANEYALSSLYGRLTYDYDSKYLFEANMRYDGSSRFGEENRFGIFPSFSAGWNIAKESFMDGLSETVNVLKLRGSWGQLGNQNIGNYAHIATVNLNRPYVFGNALVPGVAVTALNNEKIKWETTTTTDIGVDAKFFGYRLGFEADYYIRKGTDVLMIPPIAATLGDLIPPTRNQGEIKNRGYEFKIDYSGNIGHDFSYNVSFNWTYNQNEVLKLDAEFISGNKVITTEGAPVNSFYGHRIIGIFQTDEQAQDSKTYGVQPGGVTTKAGDYIWEDTNEDGIVDSKDKVIIGDPNIRNSYGFSLNMNYKRFDFRTLFQGVLGRDVEQGVYGFDGRANMNMTTMWLDRWTPDNTDTNVPRVAKGYKYNTSLFVGPSLSATVIDASYLRMKNIELGYSLPEHILSGIGLSKVRFYVAGENLLTITDFIDGFDPEDARTFNNTNDSYPQAKSVTFGANIVF